MRLKNSITNSDRSITHILVFIMIGLYVALVAAIISSTTDSPSKKTCVTTATNATVVASGAGIGMR